MTDRIQTLVIFGATGDLAERLLLPGAGQLVSSGREYLFRIVGVGRDPLSDEDWRERVKRAFRQAGSMTPAAQRIADDSAYVKADVTDPDDLRRVLEACTGMPALYFALPPAVTMQACRALEQLDLPEGTVLVLEKPFGTDRQSAASFNRQLVKLVPEKQIFRVDHFLGESMVLGMLGLRFANRLFEQVWNRDNIERVEIVFDEELALEGRAGYYDTAGALVDMIQSHLLLVLAVVAMEPPPSIDESSVRGAMSQVLQAAEVHGGDPVAFSRRARYTAGIVRGRELPSYVDEPGVRPENGTETLAQVTVGIENWRWAGVPFVLRSGKALGEPRTDITVTFKEVPHLPKGLKGRERPARLRLSLTSDDVELDVTMNGAGNPLELDRVTFTADSGRSELEPYGQVLAGVLSANPTFSVRSDIVEECWRIIEPVREAWDTDAVPLDEYPAGTRGPEGW
ncbi:MAG: glucose-6-phosphate dehydrogenase [Homoserinimonas sp.]|nr:glucose-6-phosphate dehydrogenase [Homoserinimonas sp.]